MHTSTCDTCPKMQEYYDVGKCPDCGADGLLMNTKTHIAACPFCGNDFAIPLAITGLCHDDVLFNRYECIFDEIPAEAILPAAKILGTNSAQLYKSMKEQLPIEFSLTYSQSLALKEHLSPLGISFTFSPELIEYEKYEECWGNS